MSDKGVVLKEGDIVTWGGGYGVVGLSNTARAYAWVSWVSLPLNVKVYKPNWKFDIVRSRVTSGVSSELRVVGRIDLTET